MAFALALTDSAQPDWRRLAEQHFKQKTNELVDKLNASSDQTYKVSAGKGSRPALLFSQKWMSFKTVGLPNQKRFP